MNSGGGLNLYLTWKKRGSGHLREHQFVIWVFISLRKRSRLKTVEDSLFHAKKRGGEKLVSIRSSSVSNEQGSFIAKARGSPYPTSDGKKESSHCRYTIYLRIGTIERAASRDSSDQSSRQGAARRGASAGRAPAGEKNKRERLRAPKPHKKGGAIPRLQNRTELQNSESG